MPQMFRPMLFCMMLNICSRMLMLIIEGMIFRLVNPLKLGWHLHPVLSLRQALVNPFCVLIILRISMLNFDGDPNVYLNWQYINSPKTKKNWPQIQSFLSFNHQHQYQTWYLTWICNAGFPSYQGSTSRSASSKHARPTVFWGFCFKPFVARVVLLKVSSLSWWLTNIFAGLPRWTRAVVSEHLRKQKFLYDIHDTWILSMISYKYMSRFSP